MTHNTPDLCTLVDENDRAIGAKPRKEVTHRDIYRVATLWVTNSQGDVLMAQRALTKSNNPGKWGPAVAGTVEPHESYEENIYKEAEEEIGITGQKFRLGPKRLVDEDGRRRFFEQWFTVAVDWKLERFTFQPNEVAAIAWIPAARLRDQLTHNDGKYLINATQWAKLFLS